MIIFSLLGNELQYHKIIVNEYDEECVDIFYYKIR